MLYWICVHASELLTTLGHLSPSLDVVPWIDMTWIWALVLAHLHTCTLDGGHPTSYEVIGKLLRALHLSERTLHPFEGTFHFWAPSHAFSHILRASNFRSSYLLTKFFTTRGTPFEEVVPPFRRSFHMWRRMTWHLRRVYLIWGASLGSFNSSTLISWLFYVFLPYL